MESLLANLRTAFQRSSMGGCTEELVSTVKGHLNDYVTSGHQDWRPYRLFAPCKYARNLVDISMDFEAIVLCWDDNQVSPIHNHTAQNCWFVVLEGTVSEVYYTYDAVTKTVQEVPDGETHCTAGQVGYIKDDIALHKVGSVGGKACTLHIYNKPIPFCNIYDPLSGEVLQRKSGFFSVKGHKVDPETTCLYQTIYQQVEKLLPPEACEKTSSVPLLLASSHSSMTMSTSSEDEKLNSIEEAEAEADTVRVSATDSAERGALQDMIFGKMGSIFSLVSENVSNSTKEEFSW